MITYDYIDALTLTAHIHGVDNIDLIVKEPDVHEFNNQVNERYPPPVRRFLYAGKADFDECTVYKYLINGTTINFWVLKFLPK